MEQEYVEVTPAEAHPWVVFAITRSLASRLSHLHDKQQAPVNKWAETLMQYASRAPDEVDNTGEYVRCIYHQPRTQPNVWITIRRDEHSVDIDNETNLSWNGQFESDNIAHLQLGDKLKSKRPIFTTSSYQDVFEILHVKKDPETESLNLYSEGDDTYYPIDEFDLGEFERI